VVFGHLKEHVAGAVLFWLHSELLVEGDFDKPIVVFNTVRLVRDDDIARIIWGSRHTRQGFASIHRAYTTARLEQKGNVVTRSVMEVVKGQA